MLKKIKSNPELQRSPTIVLKTSLARMTLAQHSFITKPASFEVLVNIMKTP